MWWTWMNTDLNNYVKTVTQDYHETIINKQIDDDDDDDDGDDDEPEIKRMTMII